MTDTELKALLRPYVARIAEAAQARAPVAKPAEDPPACFSDGAPLPRRIGQQFSSEAVERYADYFGCDSDNNFPGSLHRRFGVDAQTFADRTGLVLKVGRDAGGKSFAQWSQPTYGAAVFSDGGDAQTFAARGEGETWQTGGRYYERSGGVTRRVPGPDAAKKQEERTEKSEAFKKDHGGRTPKEHLEWKKEQAEPAREEARKAWEKAQADPSKLTTADTKALVDHLDALTKAELKEHARKVEAKLSGLKRELVGRLLAKVGAQPVKAEEPKPTDAEDAAKPDEKPPADDTPLEIDPAPDAPPAGDDGPIDLLGPDEAPAAPAKPTPPPAVPPPAPAPDAARPSSAAAAGASSSAKGLVTKVADLKRALNEQGADLNREQVAAEIAQFGKLTQKEIDSVTAELGFPVKFKKKSDALNAITEHVLAIQGAVRRSNIEPVAPKPAPAVD